VKVFHCDHCRNLIFFESTVCVKCRSVLAYLPEFRVVASLDSLGEGTRVYASPMARAAGRRFRLCRNYSGNNVCNWAIADESDTDLCPSCTLTRTIPDLTIADNIVRWAKLETAKRRLLYTLMGLGLPTTLKSEDCPEGLTFDFLADGPDAKTVLTGHADGVITLNVAEADDPEREQRRVQLGEMYRTLLGHFRHEVGHYYWNRLVASTDSLPEFRRLFGDETADYGEALQRHYADGPPADWRDRFVSAYASSHPWEDWAETWSHYLHMVDTMETAAACGLSLRPPRHNEPSLKDVPDPLAATEAEFERIMAGWHPITYALNNLNRGLGLPDPYPFVIPPQSVEKLRFVHDAIQAHAATAP
jgi:hypothetical protein